MNGLSETLDEVLAKFSHHFEEGQRVRVKETGHCGRIKTINRKDHANVMLDSGHFIECHPREIEPEDFPGYGEMAAPGKASGFALERLRPFLAKASGLARAMDEGRVSAYDELLVRTSLAKAMTPGVADVDPFACSDTENDHVRLLRYLAEKYEDSGPLAKLGRLAPNEDHEFHEGQRVRDKTTQKKGTIQRLSYGVAHVDFDDGMHAIVVGDYLEACAA